MAKGKKQMHEGWWQVGASPKLHYFAGPYSLCGKYSLILESALTEFHPNQLDDVRANCAECKEVLAHKAEDQEKLREWLISCGQPVTS